MRSFVRDLARVGCDVILVSVDRRVGIQHLDESHAIAARSDREHTGTHAPGELHGEVADAAAGTEDHDRLAGLEGQRVIQAAKRGHRVHGHRARLLGRQLVGDARDVVGLDRGVLCVETALGIQEAESVDAVAWLEPLDAVAHGRKGAPAIGAKYIRELRLDAEFPGEAALALEQVPLPHAGALDMDQHLIWPNLAYWKYLNFHRLTTAKMIERDRLHCPLRCLDHSV